jgi:hypothetical protein
VADAQLFHTVSFCGPLASPDSAAEPGAESPSAEQFTPSGERAYVPDQTADRTWRRRYEHLQTELRREEAERRVEGFVREGRLVPAQASIAMALLQAEDTIEFDGESRPVRQLLIAMIERQAPHGLFGAAAPEIGAQANAALLLPEEAEFYRRHFPDVSLEEIAARKRRPT